MNRSREVAPHAAKTPFRASRVLGFVSTCTAVTLLAGTSCSTSSHDADEDDNGGAATAGTSAGTGSGGSSAGASGSLGGFSITRPADPVAGSDIPAAEAWHLENPEAAPEGAWASDCEQYYSFRAHGEAKVNDTSKYKVPASSEYYESFFFSAPWGANEVQALEFRPRIDNKKIVHHWIVYGVATASRANGTMQGSPQQFLPTTVAGEAFINGWAPGGEKMDLPSNVGLYIPSGEKATFRLEIHYNNLAGGEAEDNSGVDFCVTTKKREQEAATHWLGTPNFSIPAHSTHDVVATCNPKITSGPVHIISMSPHMHQTGVHAKATLKRADGSEFSMIDGPFSFADQKALKMPQDGSTDDLLINAGDSITTTCTFDNKTNANVGFGENTTDEMCFFYTTAWPRGQLMNAAVFSIIPGAERSVSCLQ